MIGRMVATLMVTIFWTFFSSKNNNLDFRPGGGNSGCLLPLRATATTTRSNKRAARWMTSKWPLVSGSKLPG